MLSFVASVIWIEESYPPVLLARKAQRLRLESQDWALHAKSEEQSITFKDMASKYLIVPFEMMVDPAAFAMNLYSAFTYGILYL
jgi:hypothetical protein